MKSRYLFVAAFVSTAMATLAPNGSLGQECGCERSICSAQGFEISLVDFKSDADNGVSMWTYEICNDKDGNQDCVPPVDFHHMDIVLPGLSECLTDRQRVSVHQVGCSHCDPVLQCSIETKDPACGLCKAGTGGLHVPCEPPDDPVIKVLRCAVAAGSKLDAGECANIEVTIAGEQPSLGAGSVDVLTAAINRECATDDGLCGPACGCGGPATEPSCLTRTGGFWGTHPAIAAQFLPVQVCGSPLTEVGSGTCSSVVEALCVSPGLEANRRLDRNPAYAAMVRQLAVAKLNINASQANGGDCAAAIKARIAECEGLCDASKTKISNSGCIEDLDDFNNSQDTLLTTPAPFDNPGPATPATCNAATGNGIVIGKKCN